MHPSRQHLLEFVRARSRLLVITGAGISAESGIPTYRDDTGSWQRSQPIQHQEFIRSEAYRRRYWSRSAVGWPPVANARPNRSHRALAALETAGKLSLLVTQNVDRLHQRAGHQKVIDLHGRLDRTVCLDCGQFDSRISIQQQLLAQNPFLENMRAPLAPDGDADIDDQFISQIINPVCSHCGGTPMPDVVFYGGSVPRSRVAEIQATLEQCDGLLVVGSSLMVYSVYRFCQSASKSGIPIAAINRGATRADPLLALKITQDCGETLDWLAGSICAGFNVQDNKKPG